MIVASLSARPGTCRSSSTCSARRCSSAALPRSATLASRRLASRARAAAPQARVHRMLAGVWPSYLLMRVGAQWIDSNEELDPDPPGWLGSASSSATPAWCVLILGVDHFGWLAPPDAAGRATRGLAASTSSALLVAGVRDEREAGPTDIYAKLTLQPGRGSGNSHDRRLTGRVAPLAPAAVSALALSMSTPAGRPWLPSCADNRGAPVGDAWNARCTANAHLDGSRASRYAVA